MNKTCRSCKEEKAVNEFSKNVSKADGLQISCKICCRNKSKKYYKSNSERMKKQIASSRHQRREEAQQILLDLFRKSGCSDCPEKDILVLEFDHVRGKKVRDISRLVATGATKLLLEELPKCDIVCANCHRRRT